MTVFVELQLQFPYAQSLETIHELVRLWRLNLLLASTRNPKVKLSFPKAAFERMFNVQPRKGDLIVPDELRQTVARMWVTEVSTK